MKYRWRTLQLLPGTERCSYAGAVADVLEGLDGQLAVRYRGEIIPSQEAPPRPGILRSFNDSSSHGTPPRPDLLTWVIATQARCRTRGSRVRQHLGWAPPNLPVVTRAPIVACGNGFVMRRRAIAFLCHVVLAIQRNQVAGPVSVPPNSLVYTSVVAPAFGR